MKKFTDTTKMMLLMAMMTLTAFSFTSCDDYYYEDYWDEPWYGDYYRDPYDRGSDYLIQLAQKVRGKWEGTLYTCYYDDYGVKVEGNYETVFEFDQYSNKTTNGRGVEVDYLDGEQVYYDTFSWYIDEKTEDIYLKFDTNGRTMVMYSFHVDNDRFYGEMESKKTGEYNEFDLYRYTYANDSGNTFEAEGDVAAPAVKKASPEKTVGNGKGGHKE